MELISKRGEKSPIAMIFEYLILAIQKGVITVKGSHVYKSPPRPGSEAQQEFIVHGAPDDKTTQVIRNIRCYYNLVGSVEYHSINDPKDPPATADDPPELTLVQVVNIILLGMKDPWITKFEISNRCYVDWDPEFPEIPVNGIEVWVKPETAANPKPKKKSMAKRTGDVPTVAENVDQPGEPNQKRRKSPAKKSRKDTQGAETVDQTGMPRPEEKDKEPSTVETTEVVDDDGDNQPSAPSSPAHSVIDDEESSVGEDDIQSVPGNDTQEISTGAGKTGEPRERDVASDIEAAVCRDDFARLIRDCVRINNQYLIGMIQRLRINHEGRQEDFREGYMEALDALKNLGIAISMVAGLQSQLLQGNASLQCRQGLGTFCSITTLMDELQNIQFKNVKGGTIMCQLQAPSDRKEKGWWDPISKVDEKINAMTVGVRDAFLGKREVSGPRRLVQNLRMERFTTPVEGVIHACPAFNKIECKHLLELKELIPPSSEDEWEQQEDSQLPPPAEHGTQEDTAQLEEEGDVGQEEDSQKAASLPTPAEHGTQVGTVPPEEEGDIVGATPTTPPQRRDKRVRDQAAGDQSPSPSEGRPKRQRTPSKKYGYGYGV
jgi:hypothetical protein